MDKIYSRPRIQLPKFNCKYKKQQDPHKNTKVLKVVIIFIVALITVKIIINSVSPIIDKNCINMAKSIATKVANEQATVVMNNYKYEDLSTITKDNNGNIKMISANVVSINEIISDIAVKIQEELNNEKNSKFKIKLGSFLGSRMLSGRGPEIEIKMSTIGNLDTDLRSEFIEAGINQTLHKIYLQVDCEVCILTPFKTIEEKISNQVLLSESVIVGTTPSTYYNFNRATDETPLEVIE